MGWDNIRVDAIGLAAEVVELRNEIARLNGQTNWVCSCGGTDCKGQQENADLRGTLDAVIEADGRAADLWRAAHPGKELVIPDRAKLVGWLLEQHAALRKDSARLDWLTNSLGWIIVGYPEADPSQHATEDNTIADAWRAAIDAARKEAQP
jgi:hypothetical protein